MDLDNSMAVAFRKCPYFYFEKYENKLERIWSKPGEVSARDFGTRVHELLEEYYRDLKGDPIVPYQESENPALELEAQALMAAYRNQYPVESFHIVDVERTFKVSLDRRCPECGGVGGQKMSLDADTRLCSECGERFTVHNALGKFDVVFEDPESDSLIIMDHKTEKRNGRRNEPKAWAARSQASVYIYAAEKFYGRPIRHLELNVLMRQSDKGQIGPTFPPRQTIQRNEAQIAQAVRDMNVVADTIEEYRVKFEGQPWPSDTEKCVEFGECDFYPLHVIGRSDELLTLYKPTVPYLDL